MDWRGSLSIRETRRWIDGYSNALGRFKGGLVDIVDTFWKSRRGIQNTKPMLFL
jgi:hypothetical protein